MPALREALTWTIDQPGRVRSYVYHDAGEVLGHATRVPAQPADDLGLPYPDPHVLYDESRVVVCLADAAGTPYCYIDRTAAEMSVPPAQIVAPDGNRIGYVQVKGTRGYILHDAAGAVVAMLGGGFDHDRAEEKPITTQDGAELGGYLVAEAPSGENRRRYTVRLHRPLPEPARTLMLASMVGMELHVPVS
ncbi:hypothetical protein SAMN05443665_102172 [Actinomadura meyerae]|jgi:hypothetical protein|uniref:Uncharacterized protein n=1 Tax=Actinomadura meyerae TaxID=240840 RepID=A0A239L767_9ACTN|nr:hypothetical protein [Actinomadura meyerae]SNT26467.1 hypothetical protein SAMN05443665_102172 [Actinomadura meyerae]